MQANISNPTFAPTLPAIIEQTARKVFESFTERLKKQLGRRQERALKLALNGHVMHKSGHIFSVRSEEGNHAYLVDLGRHSCTCPDCKNGYACKHRLAAYLVEQANQATEDLNQYSGLIQDPNKLEIAKLVLDAKSQTLRDAIIYALIEHQGVLLGVEVVNLEGEAATVRALPKIKDNHKLVPLFPFDGSQSITQVLAQSLMNITIFR